MPDYSATCSQNAGESSLPATVTLGSSAVSLTTGFPDLPIPGDGDWNVTVNVSTNSPCRVRVTVKWPIISNRRSLASGGGV